MGLCVLYSKSNNQKGIKFSDLKNKNHPEKQTIVDVVNGMKWSKRRYLQVCKFRSLYYAVIYLMHSLSVSLKVLIEIFAQRPTS